ncbi:MAG TPA: SpoIID/LytB domain-containing protein, partial [bacterium (Candidatus Stahlbacteria)]|nr:SpoIID/LytB domain-containing protein [Candidatus Stahlbacteria bacterium]
MLLISILLVTIRVGILIEVDSVMVEGRFYLKTNNNWYHAEGEMVFKERGVYYNGRKIVVGLPVLIRPKQGFLMVNQREYPGDIKVIEGNPGITVINSVGLEDYVASVVRWEMGRLQRDMVESLKAQAVCVRTYAVRNRNRLLSGTQDQIYRGVIHDSVILDAVRATEGEVITYNGEIIDAKYHSTCGGRTAPPSEVWPVDDPPYLVSISDDHFCQGSPHFRWHRLIPISLFYEIISRVAGRRIRGPVRMRLLRGKKSKRLKEIEIGDLKIPGYRFRQIFNLKSQLFKMQIKKDAIIITGWGWGHGVGMCQWGAIGMAR